MKDFYNKECHRYTPSERKTIDKLFKAGTSDEDIALVLGRTEKAIQCQRVKQGLKKKKGRTPRLEYKPPTKGARYTRYMKPQTEVSIFWGLIKFTKT